MARGRGSREGALEDPTGWDDGFCVAFCLIAGVGRVPGEATDGSWCLHPLAVVAEGEHLIFALQVNLLSWFFLHLQWSAFCLFCLFSRLYLPCKSWTSASP